MADKREWYTSGELLSVASSAYDAGVNVGKAAERESVETESTRQCCQEMAEQCDVLLAALKHCRMALRSLPSANRGEQSVKTACENVISAAIARAEGR